MTLQGIYNLCEKILIKLEELKQAVEMSSAKVITDLSSKMDLCECTDKILNVLNEQQASTDTKVENKLPSSSNYPGKYKWPNEFVGNLEFGQKKDPGSISWPFDKHVKRIQ